MSEHHSTSRVLDIIELIAKYADKQFALSNIAKELDAPKSSILPMLQTLVQRRYLNYDENSKLYRLGAKCYEVGSAYKTNGVWDKDINKILRKITETCQETSHFAELVGSEVFYLNKQDSNQSIRMVSSVGKLLPAYATGLGKALLSDKTEDEIRYLYPNGLYAITEKTVTSFNLLFEQMKSIRNTGFAYEIEESNQYIRCIAVPIVQNKKVRYALSVAVPIFRYSEEKEVLIKSLLLEAKREIENSILPQ